MNPSAKCPASHAHRARLYCRVTTGGTLLAHRSERRRLREEAQEANADQPLQRTPDVEYQGRDAVVFADNVWDVGSSNDKLLRLSLCRADAKLLT